MADPTPQPTPRPTPPASTYVIVIRGRPSARLLRPLLDDFRFEHTSDASGDGSPQVTRLTGDVRDAAHLHGIVAHLTSVNVDLISIAPFATAISTPPTQRSTHP